MILKLIFFELILICRILIEGFIDMIISKPSTLSQTHLCSLKSHSNIKNDGILAGKIIAAKLARDELLTCTNIKKQTINKNSIDRIRLILTNRSNYEKVLTGMTQYIDDVIQTSVTKTIDSILQNDTSPTLPNKIIVEADRKHNLSLNDIVKSLIHNKVLTHAQVLKNNEQNNEQNNKILILENIPIKKVYLNDQNRHALTQLLTQSLKSTVSSNMNYLLSIQKNIYSADKDNVYHDFKELLFK